LAPTYVTAASPEKSKTWTARELIEKITESERKIRNWEVHAEYEYQALNGYKVVYDMGYDQGKKYEQGTYFYSAGKANILNAPPGAEPVCEPAYTSEFKHVFDGTKCYKLEDDISFPVREGKASVKYKGKRGSIGPGDRSLTFSNWGPHELLGHWVGEGFRGCKGKTLGKVLLRHIDKVRIRRVPEDVNGHRCVVMEVLGVSKYAPKRLDVPDELRFWIDTERDFRPLKITTYHVRYRGRSNWKKELSGTHEITKLTKVDGIWFPIEYKRDNKVVRIKKGSIRLNKGVDPNKFGRIEFQPGYRVSDLFTDEHYIVGEFSDPGYEPKTPVERVLKGLRNREVEVDPEFTDDFINVLRAFHIFDDKDKWCAAVRGLVLIGRPAVPALIAELKRKRTKNKPATLSALARTLGAIGDPCAVPALINALEGGWRPGNEYGLGEPKTDLLRFMKKHQWDPSEPRVQFSAPAYEITKALGKLTGHSEGYRHLCECDLRGRPIPCGVRLPKSQILPMESKHEVAHRWRQWWSQNKRTLIRPER
jgi:hypothetical protein